MIDWRRIRVEEFPTTSSHRWGGVQRGREMIVNYSTANRRRGGVVAGLGRGPPMGIEYNHFRQPADPAPGGMYWDRAISSSSATQEQEKTFVGATAPRVPQRFHIYDFRDFYANNYSFAVYRSDCSNAGTHRHAACAQLLKGRKTSEPSSSASAAKFRLRLPLPATRPWSGNPLTFGLPALQEVGSLGA